MHYLRMLLLPVIFMTAMLPCVQAAEPQPRDVRIVIDISGSMKETDPKNLRRPALNLLTELLPADAKSGVWTFGRYVDATVAHGDVNDAWRAEARRTSNKINSLGLNTNLTGALDRALVTTSPSSGYAQSVILLTDGRIDMDNTEGDPESPANRAERQRLFSQILPAYRNAGVKIHTLALSDNADKDTLKQISMETDGLFLQARTAEDLMPAFLKAFDRSVPVEQVPMDNNRFSIDGSVREFTALIFRSRDSQPTVLVAPDGTRYDAKSAELQGGVRWHQDLNFDLITISSPQSGEWFADATLDPENRVQILSDLRLRVDGLPGSLFSGVPVDLEMSLTNEGETVTEAAILQLTDVILQVTAPDGRTGSKLLSDPEELPKDGIYRESLSRLTQPGEYEIEVIARGRTFERRSLMTATLAEPMTVSTEPVPEEQRVHISVRAESDLVDRTLSRVMARVTSPDGGSLIRSMEFSDEEQAWSMDLRPEKGDGKYEVMLIIRGVSASGMTFKSKPESMRIKFPLSADLPHSEPVLNNLLDQPLEEEEPEDLEETQVEEPAEPEEETAAAIVPDLAQKFADQQAQESVPEEETAPEEEADESSSGLSWWVYLILGLVNLTIIGGGVWWWLKRRKKGTEELEDDDILGDEAGDDVDLTPGDFDLFDSDEEEDIPGSDSAPVPPVLDVAEDEEDFSVDVETESEPASEPEPTPEPPPQPAPETEFEEDPFGGDDVPETEPEPEEEPEPEAEPEPEKAEDEDEDSDFDDDWGEFDLPEDDDKK